MTDPEHKPRNRIKHLLESGNREKSQSEFRQSNRCPNCDLSTQHQQEGQCIACGWKAAKDKKTDNESIAGCLVGIALLVAWPLILSGIGYSLWGLGGLLTGFGVSIMSVVILITFALVKASSKDEDKS